MTEFHPPKNKKVIDYRFDHTATLLSGFQDIAFRNVSIPNTLSGVLQRAIVNSQYESIK